MTTRATPARAKPVGFTSEGSLDQCAERWAAYLDPEPEFDDENGELDPLALVAYGLSALQQAVDRAQVDQDQTTRRMITKLGAAVVKAQSELAETEAQRKRLANEAVAMRARIAALEVQDRENRAKTVKLTKAFASLTFELARDRAHRAMLEQRKFDLPTTRAVEEVRRRTDRIIAEVG